MIFIVSDQTSYSCVKTFKHQHITLLSLNRPDEKNRLNAETVSDLRKVISEFENDCSSTVAILYGEGGSFCAGLEPEMIKSPGLCDVIINKHLYHRLNCVK